MATISEEGKIRPEGMFISLPTFYLEIIYVADSKCSNLVKNSILYAILCIEFTLFYLYLQFKFTLHIYVYKYGVELLTGISVELPRYHPQSCIKLQFPDHCMVMTPRDPNNIFSIFTSYMER